MVHTGKDCHPEAKRLATLAYWKQEKRVAVFFERWPADADHPVEGLLGGSVEDLESTGAAYDPDDAARGGDPVDADRGAVVTSRPRTDPVFGAATPPR